MTHTITASVEGSAERQGIALDAAQRAVLDEAAAFLEARRIGGVRSGPSDLAGFYVHGPAGRGKTWLMAEVFEAAEIPREQKRRVHFHTFFQDLQRRFGAGLSARSAIEATVDELLQGARLFFFDELHVHDPGGASLLNRLLDELSQRGIPTLITSNYAPDGLLPNPVYHHVFAPGIRIISERFAVRTLDGGADYRRAGGARRGTGFASGRWVAIAGAPAAPAVRAAGLEPPAPGEAARVLHGHRALRALAVRGAEVWFDFADLLEAPSIAEDYLDLASSFESWVLTGVPPLSRASREARQRFVSLIDVLVHADLPLTVFAETDRSGLVDIADPPPDLFRAESRLALLGD